jgi:small subunit ribosomal protein S13
MARISGVTIPVQKQVWVALTYIYGIGPKTSYDILDKSSVEYTTRVKDLSDDQIKKIQDVINDNIEVEGELQRNVVSNIKRLKEIRAYRGLRHQANLPSRGQRTKTNARTRRGKKLTVGGTNKKTPSKT